MSKKQSWVGDIARGIAEGATKGVFAGTTLTATKKGVMFKKEKQLNNIWALVMFLIALAGIIILYKSLGG